MNRTLNRVFVIGVGMTKFEKPGRRSDFDYPDMAKEAVTDAIKDAGISYKDFEQAFVGYVYGDSACGQRALYTLGMTGIPIVNVSNNCSTGSSALYLAAKHVAGGLVDCVLALGFEKMQRGSLSSNFSDRTSPMDKHIEKMTELYEFSTSPATAQLFGNAGRDYMKKYNVSPDVFAKVAWKNHKHSINNPNSQFRDEYSLEEIKNSPMIYEPLTKLQCCPTSDGGAAAVIVSESFIQKHPDVKKNAVEILAIEMATDLPSTFDSNDCMRIVGYDMAKRAAQKAYAKAGIKPSDVQVVELHDCFSVNELITYEALGLCEEGKAGELVERGDNTYGGKYVVNPSGGLISKGHPLGATGLAQCAELCWQLRNQADKRQVKGARIGLQHNIGLGGACIVGIYRLATFDKPRVDSKL
ncbi:unnamed protein product [Rotaria sordida]|uniref:propanoyl-CoA C-acyltransferase n=1 Tax=Rotaria sordida TaxID=392033 RepID=A0A813W4V6_9BILA|nr:unnamed protein product [Rotaria sordida]CAF0913750.1 unnamed protein product [Rotaria sordida]